MEPARPYYKRKQYLVLRTYQLRLVGRLFLIMLAITVISAGIAGLLLRQVYSTDQGVEPWLVVGLIAVAVTVIAELLLAVPLIIFLGIRTSHRLVGSINRMKHTLGAIGQGDFSQRLTIRRGDALEEVVQSINQMAERLEQRSSS